eukprot:SAG11_NODE_18922_length_478_cov_0.841689_1_plen_84_part_10
MCCRTGAPLVPVVEAAGAGGGAWREEDGLRLRGALQTLHAGGSAWLVGVRVEEGVVDAVAVGPRPMACQSTQVRRRVKKSKDSG